MVDENSETTERRQADYLLAFLSRLDKAAYRRFNKSPDAVRAIANRYESPKRRPEPAQVKRARRVPAITLSNSIDGRRLGRRDVAKVTMGGGGMALLLAGDAQVECVSKLERVARRRVAIIHREHIFSDEIGRKFPPYADAV